MSARRAAPAVPRPRESMELANRHLEAVLADRDPDAIVARTCEVCGLDVPVVNYAVERGTEVGYLGRHWRPGTARTSKCRGSFGGWDRTAQ